MAPRHHILCTINGLPALFLLGCVSVLVPGVLHAGVIQVTSTADSGPGSLRTAIAAANGAPGPDVIVFTTGTATITPASDLPPLIDAGTEIQGDTGPITLQGGSYGPPSSGIIVDADSCIVRGFTIDGFDRGIWVRSFLGSARFNRIGGPGPEGNTLTGNDEGIRLEGKDVRFNTVLGNTVDQSGSIGIVVTEGPRNNQIGPDNGVTRSGQDGILLTSLNLWVADNTVVGNSVGTDLVSSVGLGNARHGIFVESPPCTSNTVVDNLVVENGGYGILLGNDTSLNHVQSNLAGCDMGMARPNQTGIGVSSGAHDNVIGPGNVASGNLEFGIAVVDTGTVSNLVFSNHVGLDPAGAAAIPNQQSGIFVNWVPNTFEGNRVGGNGNHGIEMRGPYDVGYATFHLNRVGTDSSGTYGIPNMNHGIAVADSARDTQILYNLISANGQAGVLLDTGSDNCIVRGNDIGVDASGTLALPNDVGLLVASNANVIGGSFNLGEGNTIKNNTTDGARVTDHTQKGADWARFLGNVIEDNGDNGIWFQEGAEACTVGESIATRNRIRNNGGHGVMVGETGCTDCPVGITIEYNSITANAGDAIDILSSTPPGNNGIPSPVILGAVEGFVWGATNLGGLATNIQLFVDPEGETDSLVAEVAVASGTSTWTYSGGGLTAGDRVTATNTASYPLSTDPVHTSEPADSVQVGTGPASLAYNGLLNEALGGATLSLSTGGSALEPVGTFGMAHATSSSATLTVGNLDSSGGDGVRVVARGPGAMIGFDSLPDPGPTAPPDGTMLELAARLRTAIGDTSDIALSFTYRESPDRAELSADFTGLGLSTVLVQLLDQGTLVATGDASASMVGNAYGAPLEAEARTDIALSPRPAWPGEGPTLPLPGFTLAFPPGTMFDLPDLGGMLTADEIRVIGDLGSIGFPQNPIVWSFAASTTINRPDRLLWLDVQMAAQPGPNALTGFTLVDEAIGIFGECLRGAGQALLNPLPGPQGLVVSNIGSSGNDGLHVPWPAEEEEVATALRDPDPMMASPPGMVVMKKAFRPEPAPEYIATSLTRTATGYEASFDYSTLNADSLRFEAYDGDMPVGEVVAMVSATAELDAFPWISRTTRGGSFEYDAAGKIAMDLPGLPPVLADRLMVSPVNPQVEPTDWDDHLVTGKDVPGGILELLGRINLLDLGGGEMAQGLGKAHVSLASNFDGQPTPGWLAPIAVGNIGDSGKDGVRIVPAGSPSAIDLTWGPLGPAGILPPGMTVEIEIVALMGGVSSPGGTITVGGGLACDADFEYVGATMLTARAFSQGVLVAEMTGLPNGTVATTDEAPVGGGGGGGTGTPSHWLRFRPGTMITLGAGGMAPSVPGASTAVSADLLVVLPEDAADAVSGVVEARVRVADMPYILVTGRTFSEPLLSPPEENRARARVFPAAPNPFLNRTTVTLDLARPGPALLQVFDLAGRKVATLADEDLAAGRHGVSWDGRDDAGRRVGAGVYFLRVRAPGVDASSRIVRLR